MTVSLKKIILPISIVTQATKSSAHTQTHTNNGQQLKIGV